MTAGQLVMMSWAFQKPQFGTNSKGNHFLVFRVSGFLHKGRVQVVLEGNDTYTVKLLNLKNEVKKEREMVYCDEIGTVIDEMVEKNCEDSEYKSKVDKAKYKL